MRVIAPDWTGRLEPSLVPVDRLAASWARGDREGGRLHPLEAMRLMHDGAILGGAPPPPADDLIAFDQCYLQSTVMDRVLIDVWYKTGWSSDVRAKKLGISRTKLYARWKEVLNFYRGWLQSHGVKLDEYH